MNSKDTLYNSRNFRAWRLSPSNQGQRPAKFFIIQQEALESAIRNGLDNEFIHRCVCESEWVLYHWISTRCWDNNVDKTPQSLTLMLKFPERIFKCLAECRGMYIKQININKIKITLHCSGINLPGHFSMKILIVWCWFITFDTLRTFSYRSLDTYVVVWFPWVILLPVFNMQLQKNMLCIWEYFNFKKYSKTHEENYR